MEDGRRPVARKRFGQNFLVDRSAVDRIVDALAPERESPLLEIGPGTGALTERLLERAGRVAAIEVDRDLAARLAGRFPPERLVLIRGDVLDADLVDVLGRLDAAPGRRLLVAGNLPYNLSKPIANKLVRERAAVERAVLMFQKEVALRLTAPPGGRDYGPPSVLAALTFEVRRLFDLPPGAFRPRPKVTSTVTRWLRRFPDPLDGAAEERLRRCLRVCFRSRRQTLRNNLRAAWGRAADEVLEHARLRGDVRPERVSPEEYMALSRAPQWFVGEAGGPPL
jgi:16S rRNA (adenine1518-N6/adenine1519-N6)-dimethyltransferase